MANTYAPFGFRTLGHLDGSPPTMGLQSYLIASTDATTYFTGDPVQMSSNGGLYIGTPSSNRILGIFNGCEFYQPAAGRTVWSGSWGGAVTGSTYDARCWVVTDPEMLFTVQVGTTTAGTISTGSVTSSMVGNNIGFGISTGGNVTTGQSAAVLCASAAVLTAVGTFQVVDLASNVFPPGVNGTDATSASNIVVVRFNNTSRRAGVIGIA